MFSAGRPTAQNVFKFSGKRVALCAALAFVASACKQRLFNDAKTTSENTGPLALSPAAEAQAEALVPFWPVPKDLNALRQLPTPSSLGISTAVWQGLLKDAFSEIDSSGDLKPLTLSNPECARSTDAWRVSSARLAPYEVDLPGSVSAWQTLALQRETDLAHRVQLHVTLQPWCSSERLGRSDFVHTLDHAFLLTFDLSLPHLAKKNSGWIEEILFKSLNSESVGLRSDAKVLPYARFLQELHDSPHGRRGIVRDWNTALQTQELLQKKILPSAGWQSARQSLPLNRGLVSISLTGQTLVHPLLQNSPVALNAFFSRYVSEKNLIRVRAHITEGLGTSQRFLRWERQAAKLVTTPLQTVAAQWDRSSNTITLSPLQNAPQKVARVGAEQPIPAELRASLKSVDLELTPLANDLSVQELLGLAERTSDPERTTVHSTRCVSCHGLDDALRMARDGRPVAQRGINPAQLTLFGVSADARPVFNSRTLRAAESDALRLEEELPNAKRSSQR